MATIFARYCSCCDKKHKANEGEFQFKNRTNSKGTPSTYENDVNKIQTPHKKTYSFIFNQQVSPVAVPQQLIQSNNNTRNLSQDNTNVSRLFHKQTTTNNNNNISAVSQGNNNSNSNQSNISRYSYSNSVSNVMVSISSSNSNSNSNNTHSQVSHVDHNGDNYFNSVESSSSSSSNSRNSNTRKVISSLTKPRATTAVGTNKVKAITPEELMYVPKRQ